MPLTEPPEQSAAFNAGSDARLSGVPINRCPFPDSHRPLRRKWLEGWHNVHQHWPHELPPVPGFTQPQES